MQAFFSLLNSRKSHTMLTLLLVRTSDVPDSFLSSQSHKPFESESSQIFSSRNRAMTWPSRVRSESQELSSHHGPLVFKLEPMSSQMKLHFFSMTYALKWHPTCCEMVPNIDVASLTGGYLYLCFFQFAFYLSLLLSVIWTQARNQRGIWGICPQKFLKHCTAIFTFVETFKKNYEILYSNHFKKSY